ncbi:unnamed protein product [Closterium sp. NIES-53]
MGKVGDASVFWVWGSRAFVRDTFADKLSPRAIPYVCLGFVPDAPGWQFYHPTSRRVFPSQDVTFDESFPFTASSPSALPLPRPRRSSLLPGSESGGAESGGVETGGDEPGGARTGGAEPGGVAIGGAKPGGVATGSGEPGGAELEGVEPGGTASEGEDSGVAEPQGAASSGGSAGTLPRLSLQQLREWFVRRTRLRSGAYGAGGTGVAAEVGVHGGTATTGPGGARAQGTGAAETGGVEGAGAGDLTESGTTGAGGAGAGGAGVGGPGVGGAGAGGAGAVDPGGTVRPRPHLIPLLKQVLGTPPSAALTPPLLCPPPDQSQPLLLPASPLPAPSPYTEQSSSLTERREPLSRLFSPVRTARRVPRSRPPPVPDTHAMTLRPSCVPLRVPLPAPLESSLPESAATPALVAELLDFAAACRLDYATAHVAESASASPPFVGGECAIGTDVLQDMQEDFECLAAAVPRFASMLLAPEGDPDAPDIPTPCSYGEAITGPYPSQWQAAMDGILEVHRHLPDPSVFLRTDTSLPPFYVLVYVGDLVFATADIEALTLVKSFSASVSSSPRHSPLLCLLAIRSQLHLWTSPKSGMGLVLGGRGPVVLTGHADAFWVDASAMQWPSQGYTFSLGSGSVSWRSTRSSSVLSSNCEAEIYAGAMAAQELHWLTYLLTNLGEQPRSPPVLYVDNKAMIALCQEHRQEHGTRVAAAWPASSCLRGH